jgi:hypothetical protein
MPFGDARYTGFTPARPRLFPHLPATQTLLLKGVVATEAVAAGQRRAGGGIVCV